MDFLARVVTGFCPVIVVKSLMALSKARPFVSASPSPMFKDILISLGTAITLSYSNSSCMAGIICSLYVCLSLGVVRAAELLAIVYHLVTFGAEPYS